MPRTARGSVGGYTYHVVNRGNARSAVFQKRDDYHAFIEVMTEASVPTTM
jgi:putative transposase